MTDAAKNVGDGFDSLVIYTAISGGYDFLRPVPSTLSDVKFVCFMDDVSAPFLKEGWEVRPFPLPALDQVRRCREVKIRPHRYFPEYRYSLWLDANILITEHARAQLTDLIVGCQALSTFAHPYRTCIYEECAKCIEDGKDDPGLINAWRRYINGLGYPAGSGLIESGVMFRSHHEPSVIKITELWWECISAYSRRDQLSFNYAAWASGFQYSVMTGSARHGNQAFVLQSHKGNPIKNIHTWLDARRDRGVFYSFMASGIERVLRKIIGFRASFRRVRSVFRKG